MSKSVDNSKLEGDGAEACARPGTQRLFGEITCAICLDFFTEPVALDCEHSFCRQCISRSWEQGKADFPCPQCRRCFPERRLRPNRVLANIVEGVRELNLHPRQGDPNLYCQRHQERLKLFCLGCQLPVCVVCAAGTGHRAHHYIPIEEAGHIYKEQGSALQAGLDAELAPVYDYLDGRKAELKQAIGEEVRRTLRPLEENLVQISNEINSFRRLIEEARTQLSHDEVPELLRDVKLLLNRCQLQHVVPTSVSTDLCTDSILGPFQFVDIWEQISALVPAPEYLKLDPKTAHPRLVLSDDLTSVTDGDHRLEVAITLSRFSHWLCALAGTGFSSGKHFWEVELGGNRSCILGVAAESANRALNQALTPQDGYWVIEVVDGTRVSPQGPEAIAFPPPEHSLRAIRLYLDYEMGRVSFYSVDDLTHIHTFLQAGFTGPVFPLFNPHNRRCEHTGPLRLSQRLLRQPSTRIGKCTHSPSDLPQAKIK